jgi:chromosome segregation ATPase
MDSSTHLAARLLEIPGVGDQESEVIKELRAALAELIERMRQVEPKSTENVKPNDRDERRLREELTATKEQLRLAEEEVCDLRRELGRSRESLREVETHVRELEHELDICRAMVREAQDAQYASEVKFTEATQLLRVHQAESESLMAKAEESEFKCSQVTFLCAALRERVTELETKVEKLKSARNYRAHSDSRSRRPTGTCTGMVVL